MAFEVRWTVFAGIVFSVVGMCLLNYYALFPDADKSLEELEDAEETKYPAKSF